MIPMIPDQTFELCTEQAAALPEEKRPALVCRFRSYATSLEFERLIEKAEETVKARPEDTPGDRRRRRIEAMHSILRALQLYAVDWRNVVDEQGNPVPFGPDMLDAVASGDDLWELAYRLPGASRLSEDSKKKLASQLHESTAPSAPAAEPADASMSPASASPS